MEPEEVMMMLHALYTKYDALCTLHGVYKGEPGRGALPRAVSWPVTEPCI